MKKLEELLRLLGCVAFGVAGTLYWLALVDDMTQFQRPAVLAGALFITLGVVSGFVQRRSMKAEKAAGL